MKRFTLTFTILCAVFTLAHAGTYAGKEKEVLQPAPPPCEWYRAHEWNLDIWGGYAFSANSGSLSASDFPGPEDEFNGVDFLDPAREEGAFERNEKRNIG